MGKRKRGRREEDDKEEERKGKVGKTRENHTCPCTLWGRKSSCLRILVLPLNSCVNLSKCLRYWILRFLFRKPES